MFEQVGDQAPQAYALSTASPSDGTLSAWNWYPSSTSERSTTNALAQILGAESLTWQENVPATSTPTVTEQPSETEQQIQTLLQAHPATLEAVSSLLSP